MNLELGAINYNLKPEKPQIFLAKPSKTTIAKLSEAFNIQNNLKLGNINELIFSIPYVVEKNHKIIRNYNADLIKERYLIYFKQGNYEEWYIINKCSDSMSENGESIKEVSCLSLGMELADQQLSDYDEVSFNLPELLNGKIVEKSVNGLLSPVHVRGILSSTNWKLGYCDSSFQTKRRAFIFDKGTILDCVFRIAETFNALIIWNTKTRTINFYNPDLIGADKGLKFNYGKYLKTINKEINSDGITTRLKVFGRDGLSINRYNPTGTNYLENFTFFMFPFKMEGNLVVSKSNYMSDELCRAILTYNNKIEQSAGTFEGWLVQKEILENDISAREIELFNLQSILYTAEDNLYVAQATGQPESVVQTHRQNVAVAQTNVNNKNTEITLLRNNLNNIEIQIANFKNELSIENNFQGNNEFGGSLIEERNQFIIEKEWVENNHIDAKELYKDAKERFKELTEPQIVVTIDIVNFLNIIEEQFNWEKLVLGDYVTIHHEMLDINIKAKIIEIKFDYEQNNINLTIANVKEIESAENKLIKSLYQSVSTSTSVDMNRFKWDGLGKDKSLVDSYINSLWDETKRFISFSLNETVDIGRTGITVSSIDNPLHFIRLTHGVIALTNDGGNTFKNAITSRGVIGERIFGKIIAGVNLEIDASDSLGRKTFTVDSTGVTISGATLRITDGGIPDALIGSADRWNSSIMDNNPPNEGVINTPIANSDGSVTITWSGFTDTESSVAGYNVWRATSINGVNRILIGTIGSNVTNTFIDRNTIHNTIYFYYVTAFDKAGNETIVPTTNNRWLQVTALRTVIPNTPTNLLAVARTGVMNLSWDTSTTTDVVSYEIDKSFDSISFTRLATTVNNSFNEHNIVAPRANLLNWRYRVRAVNSVGLVSTWSVLATPNNTAYLPADNSVPHNPTNAPTLVSNYNGTITVSWTYTHISDLAGFRVYRSENSSSDIDFRHIIDINGVNNSYLDSGLKRATQYRYRFSAVDNSGMESGLSPISGQAQATNTVAPIAPNPTAVGDVGAIRISWTEISGITGIGATYEIWRNSGSGWSDLTAVKIASVAGSGQGGVNNFVDYSPSMDLAVTNTYRLRVVDEWGNVSTFSTNSSTAISLTGLRQDVAYNTVEIGSAFGIRSTNNSNRNRIEINSSGIRISRGSSSASWVWAEDVFNVDSNGNLVIRGNITMLGGSISWDSVSPPTASQVGAISSTFIDSNNFWTGNIHANNITSGVLTGIHIQTASTGHRITLNTNNLRCFNGSTLHGWQLITGEDNHSSLVFNSTFSLFLNGSSRFDMRWENQGVQGENFGGDYLVMRTLLGTKFKIIVSDNASFEVPNHCGLFLGNASGLGQVNFMGTPAHNFRVENSIEANIGGLSRRFGRLVYNTTRNEVWLCVQDSGTGLAGWTPIGSGGTARFG